VIWQGASVDTIRVDDDAALARNRNISIKLDHRQLPVAGLVAYECKNSKFQER